MREKRRFANKDFKFEAVDPFKDQDVTYGVEASLQDTGLSRVSDPERRGSCV